MNKEKPLAPQRPLLSICIPTWNRAPLLAGLLGNIRKEIQGLEDLVEIVVADNASSDDTAKVVEECGLPVSYGKQKITVGMASNMFFAACDLAHGEFIWLVGDDDFIVPGGIRRVIESMQRAPDVGYHYINFGWVDVRLREKILRELDGQPTEAMLGSLQFVPTDWQRLEKGEDLAYLPAHNASSLFAGIFCCAARRSFYLEARSRLKPSDSYLDGSSNLLDDSFPHAMATVPNIIGKPVAYIGSPCLLQGINGWEWGGYAYKTMLLGQYELMNWLEAQGFDQDALAHLRVALAKTTGRLLARMLLDPEKHLGVDVLQERVLPAYASNHEFWRFLAFEMRYQMEYEGDAKLLATLLAQVDSPDKRIGLFGVRGRGEYVLSSYPELADRFCWLGESDVVMEGHTPVRGGLSVSSHTTLGAADLDVLVLGLSAKSIPTIIDYCRQAMKPGAHIVTVEGVQKIAEAPQVSKAVELS